MDLVDLAILALRLLLVVVLYAFLMLVLRLSARGLQPVSAPTARQTPTRTNRLQLSVVEPGGTGLGVGELLSIPDGGILGRAERASVRLADTAVSAEHARVSRVGRGWVVVDLGSTNGTRVNEASISGETPLAAGDILGLGSVRLQIVGR